MAANQDFQFEELKLALNAVTERLSLDAREKQHGQRKQQAKNFRRALWPLYLGQLIQIFFGVSMIALGVAGWTQHRDGSALMWSGLLVHAYGVACIIAAGMLFGRLSGLDPSQSVLDLQRNLASARKTYVIGGMVVGLSWWLFWIPLLATLIDVLTQGNVDFLTRMGPSIWICIFAGVAGLGATAWFHRWSRHTSRPRLKRAMENAVIGGTLLKAQRNLDALKAFDET